MSISPKKTIESIPAGIYLFKANSGNCVKSLYEICI